MGTYLRLNFERLGDYLDLLPDGSFIEEKGGGTSKGTWRSELGEVVLSMDSDAEVEATVIDGEIIDADGVRWIKRDRTAPFHHFTASPESINSPLHEGMLG